MPGARVVKAFNTLYARSVAAQNPRRTDGPAAHCHVDRVQRGSQHFRGPAGSATSQTTGAVPYSRTTIARMITRLAHGRAVSGERHLTA